MLLWYGIYENAMGGELVRRFLIVILCLLLFSALTVSVSAENNRITSLTQEITVDADGAASVKVTAVVQFVSAPETFLFPLNSAAGSVNASGGEYSKTQVNGVSCIRFSNGNGFVGTQTFICTYLLPRDASETADGQQFHICLIEQGWEYPIEAYSVAMAFPAPVTMQPTWNSSYYGDVIEDYRNVVHPQNSNMLNDAAETLTDMSELAQDGLAIDGFLLYICLLGGLLSLLFVMNGMVLVVTERRLNNRKDKS